MPRIAPRLSHLLLLALTVSSCTCGQEAPPPPAPAAAATKAPELPPTKAPAAAATVPAAAPTSSAAATATPEAVALPADFPKDIPVMDGATVAGVQKLGGGAHNVLFTTDVEPAKIFDFYKDDLKAKGHEVTQQYQAREQSFLSFKKGNEVTNIVIAKDPNDPKKKVIAVMYYEDQAGEDF